MLMIYAAIFTAMFVIFVGAMSFIGGPFGGVVAVILVVATAVRGME